MLLKAGLIPLTLAENMASEDDSSTDAILRRITGGNCLTNDDGSVRVPSITLGVNSQQTFDDLLKARNEYKWRNGDFLLASYPKNGM